jgi:hypothetical protein
MCVHTPVKDPSNPGVHLWQSESCKMQITLKGFEMAGNAYMMHMGKPHIPSTKWCSLLSPLEACAFMWNTCFFAS